MPAIGQIASSVTPSATLFFCFWYSASGVGMACARTGRAASSKPSKVAAKMRIPLTCGERRACPEPIAALERVGVVAPARALGETLEQLHVAAAQDQILGLQRGLEAGHHVEDVPAPLSLAAAFEPAQADVVLVGAAFLVWQVGQFQRRDHVVDDQRRAEPGAEPEEQHAPRAVA